MLVVLTPGQVDKGRKSMAQPSFDAEADLDAAGALLELPIDPEHRPGELPAGWPLDRRGMIRVLCLLPA